MIWSLYHITMKQYVSRIISSNWLAAVPPLVNNTNPETKTGFVLFFSYYFFVLFFNEYFGIKVETVAQKKPKKSRVWPLGIFMLARHTWKMCLSSMRRRTVQSLNKHSAANHPAAKKYFLKKFKISRPKLAIQYKIIERKYK